MSRVRMVVLVLGVLNGCALFPSLSDLSACYDGGCPASGGSSSSSGASTSSGTGTGGVGTSSSTAASSSAASSSGAGAGGSSVCGADLRGPLMVVVPAGPKVPSPYCIDSLETTFDEYRAFMNDGTVDPTTLLPPLCTGYTGFAPQGNMWDKYNVPDGGGYGTYPVSGVSWCDASAYCKWAHKRVCGAVGGGPVPSTSDDDIAVSQWGFACAKGQTPLIDYFPYGAFYDAGTCQTQQSMTGETAPVGSHKECEGAFTGLFDMSGNVAEWTDSCIVTDGGQHKCIAMGGGFDQPAPDAAPDPVTCKANSYYYDSKQYRMGIRCCSL